MPKTRLLVFSRAPPWELSPLSSMPISAPASVQRSKSETRAGFLLFPLSKTAYPLNPNMGPILFIKSLHYHAFILSEAKGNRTSTWGGRELTLWSTPPTTWGSPSSGQWPQQTHNITKGKPAHGWACWATSWVWRSLVLSTPNPRSDNLKVSWFNSGH